MCWVLTCALRMCLHMMRSCKDDRGRVVRLDEGERSEMDRSGALPSPSMLSACCCSSSSPGRMPALSLQAVLVKLLAQSSLDGAQTSRRAAAELARPQSELRSTIPASPR